uniref:Uncharacterized protein n=1 Tax=Steinernema glaseri TaxID=37863 RepID=A0A1I8ARH9_9BILA
MSTLFWLSKVLLSVEKTEYILRFMQIADGSERQKRRAKPSQEQSPLTVIRQNPQLLRRFIDDFLKSDGVFTLRLIGNHAGEFVVIEIVKCLWREFCARNWGDMEVVMANSEQNNHKTVEAVELCGHRRKRRFDEQTHGAMISQEEQLQIRFSTTQRFLCLLHDLRRAHCSIQEEVALEMELSKEVATLLNPLGGGCIHPHPDKTVKKERQKMKIIF